MRFNKGFFDFSTDAAMNFQLNRFYSMGAMEKDELFGIGKEATDFDRWIELFTDDAQEAEERGDHLRAAVCYRAAQFYTLSDAVDDKGESLKKELYEKCMEHFDGHYGAIAGLCYERIPYEEGYLPVYHMHPPKRRE